MSSTRPIVSVIAAMAENRVIGRDGQLPWRLPDEMKHFMRLTTGHTVVMGRKTFESINSKPLPNRRNIILTRNPDYTPAGVEVAAGVSEAIGLVIKTRSAPASSLIASSPTTNHQPPTTELFICGGEQAYRDALPIADRLYLTIVHTELDGDAHFPQFDTADWTLTDQTRHAPDPRHAHAFTLHRYERLR
jgi:dihydrofolate reductase